MLKHVGQNRCAAAMAPAADEHFPRLKPTIMPILPGCPGGPVGPSWPGGPVGPRLPGNPGGPKHARTHKSNISLSSESLGIVVMCILTNGSRGLHLGAKTPENVFQVLPLALHGFHSVRNPAVLPLNVRFRFFEIIPDISLIARSARTSMKSMQSDVL